MRPLSGAESSGAGHCPHRVRLSALDTEHRRKGCTAGLQRKGSASGAGRSAQRPFFRRGIDAGQRLLDQKIPLASGSGIGTGHQRHYRGVDSGSGDPSTRAELEGRGILPHAEPGTRMCLCADCVRACEEDTGGEVKMAK